MTKPLNTTQAVIEWVNNTRRYATRLDDEADALLAQLTLAAADESALNAACASHGCVGLYGYAQSAKAHLLTTLCGNENGKLEIITPDRDYDYFSHINPGHAPANMAIRFTRDIFSNESGWPLRLRLISEAELVQIFIAWTSSSPVCRQVEKSIITSRLEKWQSLRQPQPVPGVTAEEVATIASFWRSCLPSARQHIDDATWQHFASLLPALDLTTRAHAWALLWGEQPEITQQWLALAHMLQQTGHAGELAAPLSLLVDHFGLPAENFLTQMALTANDTQSDVVVHPVKEGRLLNAVSLSLDSLALLTRELVLSVENNVLDNVDLLDIPVAPDSHPHPLWRAKLGWMLAHYRQQVQPDVLVICNALASRSQTSTAAHHLLEWVNATELLTILQALKAKGVHAKLLYSRMGEVTADDGSTLTIAATFAGAPSLTVDAVIVPCGNIADIESCGDARYYLLEAYKHLKPIALAGDARRFKALLNIDSQGEEGLVEADNVDHHFMDTLLTLMAAHRVWSRAGKINAIPA